MSSDLQPGAIFAERYRIERRIASGGMGSVYEVVHLETNRRRALKVLHANLVQSDELRERFRREARVAAEIESEHIVDVFDAGIEPTTEMPFLVMELLRGEDVRQRIKRSGPIPVDETIRILFESALALDKTHQARIVHRDLKPDNIFLCERELGAPRAKVLDFGIAKIVADGAMNGQTRESLGTPLYMAPEQYLMAAGISPATDIYALGLIAFTMLVGKPYWLQETLQAGAAVAFAMHACKGPQEGAVQRAAAYGATLPPAFDAWFSKATAAKPADRYQVATTAILDLAQVLGVSLQSDTAPISITGPGGVGRVTLGTGLNVKSVMTGSGVGVVPPYRPAMGSIPGTNTPLQPVLTPIGSGLTNADEAPPRKKPMVAMFAAAAGVVLVGGLVGYQLLSSRTVPTTPELATRQPIPNTSVSVPEPEVKPAPQPTTQELGEIDPPSASTTTSTNAVKSPPATTSTTKATTTSTGTSTGRPPTNPTSTGKKPPGNVIWNND